MHIQRTDGDCSSSPAGREESHSEAFWQCFFSKKSLNRAFFEKILRICFDFPKSEYMDCK